jgi:hypothetical protein
MIVEVDSDVKEINARDRGRGYDWPRPDRCPHCFGVRIWGHGFVWAFFESLMTGLYLKRYRCPCCGCVMRMKPVGYFPGFSVTVAKIRSSVASRVGGGSWLKDLSDNRQRHWLRSLIHQVTAHMGLGWLNRLLEGFDSLVAQEMVPVSRSFKT